VTALGDVARTQHRCWHCWQGSTHNPPHKQWLVRLEVGAVSSPSLRRSCCLLLGS
jgi:hypothetical protein